MLLVQNKRVDWDTNTIGILGHTTKDKENRRIPFDAGGPSRGYSPAPCEARTERVCVRNGERRVRRQLQDHLGVAAANLAREATRNLWRRPEGHARSSARCLEGPQQRPVALDDALQALAVFDPRKAQVIGLRFFGGLSVEETAETLQVSADTVMRDCRPIKVWPLKELRGNR